MVLTASEKRTAVKVLMQSKQVRKWVEAQLLFVGIDPDSAQAEEFRKRETKTAAERLIR